MKDHKPITDEASAGNNSMYENGLEKQLKEAVWAKTQDVFVIWHFILFSAYLDF